MSAACVEAGIALVGGETAEMPAVYAEGDWTCRLCDRGCGPRALVDGREHCCGDALYAINSSGLHTNGFSLARKLIFEIGGYAIDARPEELEGKSMAECCSRPYKLCCAGEEHS